MNFNLNKIALGVVATIVTISTNVSIANTNTQPRTVWGIDNSGQGTVSAQPQTNAQPRTVWGIDNSGQGTVSAQPQLTGKVYSASQNELNFNKNNIILETGNKKNDNTIKQGIISNDYLKESQANRHITQSFDNQNSNPSQKTREHSIVENAVKKEFDDSDKKFPEHVKKATKMLFCLAIGTTQQDCGKLVREYFRCVAKPKCQPWNLIKNAATITGADRKNKQEQMQKMENNLDQAGKKFDPNFSLKGNVNQMSNIIANMEDKKMNDFLDETGNGDPNARIQPTFNVQVHHWKNKPTRHPMAFLGDFNQDGEPDNFFSCDVDPTTGLNTKRELHIERYRDDGRWKERYFLRTLTEMPSNCVARKKYFPTTLMPKYDTQKCNKAWYKAEDYLNGYHIVTDQYGKQTQVKIEKDCWYFDLAEKEKLEQAQAKIKNDILKQGMEQQWSSDKINAEIYNSISPKEYQIQVPQK